MRHIEILIRTGAFLVKNVWEYPQMFLLIERSPRVLRTQQIHVLAENIALPSHIVPVSLLEHPYRRYGVLGDARAVAFLIRRIRVLPMPIALSVFDIVFCAAVEVMSLCTCNNRVAERQELVGSFLPLIA